MRALLSTDPGGPETLTIEDLPEPEATEGHVVVDVKAVSVNFPDVLIIQDMYQVKPPRPFSPGSELAGVVSAVGEGVDGLAVGGAVLEVRHQVCERRVDWGLGAALLLDLFEVVEELDRGLRGFRALFGLWLFRSFEARRAELAEVALGLLVDIGAFECRVGSGECRGVEVAVQLYVSDRSLDSHFGVELALLEVLEAMEPFSERCVVGGLSLRGGDEILAGDADRLELELRAAFLPGLIVN